MEYENLRTTNRPFEAAFHEKFDTFLDKGWYILGKEVENFEQSFAAYCGGAKYCIGVASGLDALMLSLRQYDFPPESEVIVPSNTYIATILSIIQCGLKPILVEPDIRTYNIDPTKIEERITNHTVAIMVVHLYGKACDMGHIMPIAERHHLPVIEDCAQAHGAMYRNQKVGTFGVGAFSFYPTKNLGCLGDGGAILTPDASQNHKLRSLRNYGSTIRYQNEYVGYNSRLDEIQAAFLSIKLAHLDEINRHKRQLAKIYLQGLKSDFILPDVSEDFFDVYHVFNIRHPQRDKLKAYLLEQGVKTDIHYPTPPHRQKAMQGILDGEYPISEEIHRTTLSLPISFGHTEEEIRQVVDIMNRF
ncbi:MAG: DegT/DnrJ/EryC1/StrS family aminotransferase [Tannerella sp.]|nr:DegT/DnrJ/EryC1/StrS family aminotransferase [Tannerella sp.]